MKPIKHLLVTYIKDGVMKKPFKVTRQKEIEAMLKMKATIKPTDILIKIVR